MNIYLIALFALLIVSIGVAIYGQRRVSISLMILGLVGAFAAGSGLLHILTTSALGGN
jgi:hypothetical protein